MFFASQTAWGLADAPDVLKTEQQLMQNIPKKQWSRAHHWLIYHGRRVCAAVSRIVSIVRCVNGVITLMETLREKSKAPLT